MIRIGRLTVAVAVAALSVACGRKGPPLAPLHLVPAAPANPSVARVAAEARIRFDVPATNQNGPGPVVIDRVEVYAATVAAGAARPANRELLAAKYRVGTVPIKPPPVEGEAPPESAAADNRPAAGERATFVEALTDDQLTPVFTTPAAKTPAAVAPPPAAAATATATDPVLPGAATPAPQPPPPAYPVRLYAVRGVTRGGRPGPPAARLELPLVTPPAAPPAPAVTATETAIVLTWPAPPTGAGLAYAVYTRGAADPLSTTPAAAGTFERGGVTFGTEECFELRAVEKVAGVDVESDRSPEACITPLDTFAPAAPKALSVVAGPGTMNLGWDANAERDLAGYLVLRGEAPGDTLQPLTPAPITGTSYEDRTVRPGVRYVYAVVAVDTATPPNRSAPSARVEETAR